MLETKTTPEKPVLFSLLLCAEKARYPPVQLGVMKKGFFHWQSQSTTNADSATGQRYIHHKKEITQPLYQKLRDYVATLAVFDTITRDTDISFTPEL